MDRKPECFHSTFTCDEINFQGSRKKKSTCFISVRSCCTSVFWVWLSSFSWQWKKIISGIYGIEKERISFRFSILIIRGVPPIPTFEWLQHWCPNIKEHWFHTLVAQKTPSVVRNRYSTPRAVGKDKAVRSKGDGQNRKKNCCVMIPTVTILNLWGKIPCPLISVSQIPVLASRSPAG